METRLIWKGKEVRDAVRKHTLKNMRLAVAHLASKVILSFTRGGTSQSGEPPGIITGTLRRSIAQDASIESGQVVGRVGTHLRYGLMLELGTSKMGARPFLQPALRTNKNALARILAWPMVT